MKPAFFLVTTNKERSQNLKKTIKKKRHHANVSDSCRDNVFLDVSGSRVHIPKRKCLSANCFPVPAIPPTFQRHEQCSQKKRYVHRTYIQKGLLQCARGKIVTPFIFTTLNLVFFTSPRRCRRRALALCILFAATHARLFLLIVC